MNVYHFCAMHQSGDAATIVYYDGIAKSNYGYNDMESYRALKALIAVTMEGNPEPEKVTLLSLTLIGTI